MLLFHIITCRIIFLILSNHWYVFFFFSLNWGFLWAKGKDTKTMREVPIWKQRTKLEPTWISFHPHLGPQTQTCRSRPLRSGGTSSGSWPCCHERKRTQEMQHSWMAPFSWESAAKATKERGKKKRNEWLKESTQRLFRRVIVGQIVTPPPPIPPRSSSGAFISPATCPGGSFGRFCSAALQSSGTASRHCAVRPWSVPRVPHLLCVCECVWMTDGEREREWEEDLVWQVRKCKMERENERDEDWQAGKTKQQTGQNWTADRNFAGVSITAPRALESEFRLSPRGNLRLRMACFSFYLFFQYAEFDQPIFRGQH